MQWINLMENIPLFLQFYNLNFLQYVDIFFEYIYIYIFRISNGIRWIIDGYSVLKRVFSRVSNALCPSLESRVGCVLFIVSEMFRRFMKGHAALTTALRVIK